MSAEVPEGQSMGGETTPRGGQGAAPQSQWSLQQGVGVLLQVAGLAPELRGGGPPMEPWLGVERDCAISPLVPAHEGMG